MGPRFPNGFVPAPWAPQWTPHHTPRAGAKAHKGSPKAHDAPTETPGKASPGNDPPRSAPGDGAPPREFAVRDVAPPGDQTPDSGGPDVIDVERSYRQGPVYGSAVPTAVLRAMGFVTHMDTLRLETPALGRMAYLQAVADQHHELNHQLSHQLPPTGSVQRTLFKGPFTGDGAPSAPHGAPSAAPTGDPTERSTGHSASVDSAYQYTNIYSGREHIVRRKAGSFVKSIQGVAEDLYRRIYKRLPPAQDPLDNPEFRKIYDRLCSAMQRVTGTVFSDAPETPSTDPPDPKDAHTTGGDSLQATLPPDKPIPSESSASDPAPRRPREAPVPPLQRLGPAVPSTNKLIRDRNGQRWRVSPALQSAPPAQTAQTTRAVRSSGPAPRIPWHRPYLDPIQVAEALYAHRETLHERFTHGWKATIQDGQWTRHQPRHARRSETSIATQGSDRPSFISVGRWRQDEITRRHPDSAVTVPWIIADIDGNDPATSAEYAKTLCRLLVKRGLDPSHLIVNYTGGRGMHVRIPHGALGCPIYQDAEAASTLLTQFFDQLCTDHPQLRAAIDNTACRPTQMIRMIGSTRPHGGRCTAVTGRTFLDLNPLVLFGHSDNNHYDGFRLPKPEQAPYTPGLRYLLLPEEVTTTAHSTHQQVTQLLRGTKPPQSLQLQTSTNAQKKERTGPAIHVNQYCWKPHFSRPPPTPLLQPDPPEYSSSGVMDRLMDPVREGQAWGEAAGRPYVGRNKACFIMGLYAYTYPEAALRRVLALLTGRDGETMPGGDGAAPKGRRTGRWMQQIIQAGAPGHERADVPVGDVPASDVTVKAIVHAWNRLVCRPALPEREVDTTLRSAQKYADAPV